ncbi:MAG: hydroxymethylglutaryl-CoA lyase [Sandaracinaceae bacterium]|nr:hydroxymethylglutaryl-CoA lyase [Sandaracinaceae bacterium]
MLENLPEEVSIYEVAPRDGLQNEAVTVPTTRKARLIQALVDAGLRRIEVTSFVSPKWVPQLADAEEVIGLLPQLEGVRYSALCPNLKGLERALAANVKEIALFLSASESHNRKNINRSIDDTLALYREIAQEAVRHGLRVRGYVSTVWGCPYEGEVPIASTIRIAKKLFEAGCYEVALSDTIGVGNPLQTKRILQSCLVEFPASMLAMHMHDTRGTALANILVGVEMGIRTFDASVGGLGGCPYAPGAAGNVATEDLVYMLNGMGIRTGIDLEALWVAGQVAEAIIGRELPGKVHRAGVRSLAR